MAQRITIEDAAKIMGKSPQFIRLCLQSGHLSFGVAFKKEGNKKFDYYISPKLFYEYVGKEEEQ